MHLLRAVEAVEVLEDRSDGRALSGGAGHGSMVTGALGTSAGPGGTTKGTLVFAVTRLRATGDDAAALAAAVAPLLAALAARPGFRDGELGRSRRRPGAVGARDPVGRRGSYRRALSAAEVKIAGAPVWVHAPRRTGCLPPD